jgi:Protein of unknown function (DUF3102)
VTDIALSNSLTDLAARIKAEHEAIKVSLRESVQHAFAAGELLIEAKKQLNKHGQWLPWLREHCTISERTAQLYMRCAKSRAEIEKSARGIADLTLTEAAAMLMMSSNVKKLLEFVKKTEHITDPEEFMQVCLDSGVGVLGTIDYESGHTVEERREWDVFILFLVRKFGWLADCADSHVCWLKRRSYKSASEWMGEEGDRDRARTGLSKGGFTPEPSDQAKQWWKEFLAETKNLTRAEIHEAIGEADPNPKTKELRAQHRAIAREAVEKQRQRGAKAQRALRI